jgi:hypothetical protein
MVFYYDRDGPDSYDMLLMCRESGSLCHLLKSSIIVYDHILSHFVFDCLSLTSWNPCVPIPVNVKIGRCNELR